MYKKKWFWLLVGLTLLAGAVGIGAPALGLNTKKTVAPVVAEVEEAAAEPIVVIPTAAAGGPSRPLCEKGQPVPEGACQWFRWQGHFQQPVGGGSFSGQVLTTGFELDGLCETGLYGSFGSLYWDTSDTGGRECGTGEVWEAK